MSPLVRECAQNLTSRAVEVWTVFPQKWMKLFLVTIASSLCPWDWLVAQSACVCVLCLWCGVLPVYVGLDSQELNSKLAPSSLALGWRWGMAQWLPDRAWVQVLLVPALLLPCQRVMQSQACWAAFERHCWVWHLFPSLRTWLLLYYSWEFCT